MDHTTPSKFSRSTHAPWGVRVLSVFLCEPQKATTWHVSGLYILKKMLGIHASLALDECFLPISRHAAEQASV